jgi:hypothetical protein
MFASINGLGYTWFLDRNMIVKHLIDFQFIINTRVFQKEEDSYLLHIVKDVVFVFGEAFSIHPSRHPSMDGIIQGRKL